MGPAAITYAPGMQRSEHGGIPVFCQEGPAPLTGALVFRVGPRDETFRTRQVTHVIEHLVMSSLPRSRLDSNASVEAGSTVFYATGRPEAVADFLNAIAAALRDLPVDRLAREVGVLEAEEGLSVHPALAWSAGLRYGNAGIGLLADQGPPIDQLRAEDVLAHCRRYFVTGNAALIFTGPPPGGLDVRLPEGPPPQRNTSVRSPLPQPGFVKDDMPWPVLSFLVPKTEVPWLLPSILEERVVDDLRHRQGISYSLDGDHTLFDGQLLVALMPDGRPGHETQVTEALWRALVELAERGPSQVELDEAVGGARESMLDPRATVDNLLNGAARHLAGEPSRTVEEHLALAGRVTPAQAQDLARQALTTVLLGVPTDAKPELADLPDLTEHEPPSGTPVTGQSFRRKTLCFAAFDLRAVVGDDGISLTARSHTWSGSWDDVVGVAASAGDRGVFLRSGLDFHVCDRHLRNTQRLFDLIDDRAGCKLFTVPSEAFH
jgi:predicted Zn-dependent peptidase